MSATDIPDKDRDGHPNRLASDYQDIDNKHLRDSACGRISCMPATAQKMCMEGCEMRVMVVSLRELGVGHTYHVILICRNLDDNP